MNSMKEAAVVAVVAVVVDAAALDCLFQNFPKSKDPQILHHLLLQSPAFAFFEWYWW